ncbi:MAG: cysteine desulfurase [Gracilimonas sp.]|uniref:cysteine desulfurase family protein n=1 Tax=Gracilimonas sp. TaxID=1974203 RepID=UPI001B0781A5|nr:cysteine desulfurase family protein [Gracilimonas sp.]MBO6587036.1 cysteine desulfurase [Gracilimonas sp.]MBO6614476.1 cysteine desulfurase [Gracilimonas sp.]
MRTVYLDHAATTPLDDRVLEAMLPYLKENYGNANSPHHLGQKSKVVVEDAREKVAALIGAEPSEIIFTSGGTESDNAVIKGVLAVSGDKKEVITSELEHHAVLHTVELAKMQGVKPVFAPSRDCGTITAEAVKESITENTALVTIMHVNNEIGTINPLKEIAEVCEEHGVPLHSDTVQSLGKIPLNVKDLGIDFLSGSAHKIYGPKGTGIMYVKNGSKWIPWVHGGSQERRRRGGTLNVPGIVGFAKALELAVEEMDEHQKHFKKLRSLLLKEMDNNLDFNYNVNGPQDNGVPHIVNLSFSDEQGKYIDGEMLLLNLDIEGICVSNGSACTSGAVEPSHVLNGIGMEDGLAKSSIRVSFGKQNTEEDVRYFVEKLDTVLKRMFTVA